MLVVVAVILTNCPDGLYNPDTVYVYTHDDYPECEELLEDLEALDYSYRELDATDPEGDNYAELQRLREQEGDSDSTFDFPVVYVNSILLFNPDLVEIEEAMLDDDESEL